MRNKGPNDMVAMLCYEISTKTPPYTEEFHIFGGKKNKKPNFTTNLQYEYLLFPKK